MPRPKPLHLQRFDDKLAAILTAASQVFSEEGYDRSTMRAVADRAAVSVAGLYYYVGSKEELLYLIQYHAFDTLVRLYREDCENLTEPETRLHRLVFNHLQRFLQNLPELSICSRELDRLKGEYGPKIQAKQHEYFGLAVRIFLDLERKHGALNVNPRTAALAMFGVINWVHTWYPHEGGPSAADLTDSFCKLCLGGVLPARSSSRRSRGHSTEGATHV